MDDWITDYFDVPKLCDSATVMFLAEDNFNSIAEHQK